MVLAYMGYIGWLAAGLAIGWFIKEYFPSYMKEKGKNLATKEDIEEITKKIESVKSEFQKKHIRSQFFIEKQSEGYAKVYSALNDYLVLFADHMTSGNTSNLVRDVVAGKDTYLTKIFLTSQNYGLYNSEEISDLFLGLMNKCKDIAENPKGLDEKIYLDVAKDIKIIQRTMRKELMDE